MNNKVEHNVDWFPTPLFAAKYVLSRVGDDENGASSHLNAYRYSDPNFFKSPGQIFDTFRDICEDKDLKANARRSYTALRLRADGKFSVFYAQFRRFASILGYQDGQLTGDLHDKSVKRLRDALDNRGDEIESLSAMVIYLQRVDNNQRSTLEQERKRL